MPETTTIDSNSADTRWVSRKHCGGFVEVAYRVSCSKGETSGCRLPFLCVGFGSRDGRYHSLPGICDDDGNKCDSIAQASLINLGVSCVLSNRSSNGSFGK